MPHQHPPPHSHPLTPVRRRIASMLSCGVWQRLGLAALLLLPLWVAVAWALQA
ncbi:MAG: hypothetical protein ACK53K_02995 [Burkholderiales bacterium]